MAGRVKDFLSGAISGLSAIKDKYMIIGIMSGWFLLVVGVFLYYSLSYDSFFNTARNLNYRHQPKGMILDRHEEILVRGSGVERRYILGAAGGSTIGFTYPEFGVDGIIEQKYGDRLISNKSTKLWYLANQKEEGCSLKTTLDKGLQKTAYEAMGSTRGALIIMSLDGEVLTAISLPGYDPNRMSLKYYKALKEDPEIPLWNRAIDGRYAPGSAWKTVIAAMLLEKGYHDKPVTCNGQFAVGNKIIGCMKAHGTVRTMAEAFTQSCNVWFMKTVQSEFNGEIMRKSFARFMSRTPKKEFSEEEMALAAIGQGEVLVSPMELVQLAAVIGNKGMKPEVRFVKEDMKATKVMEESTTKTILGMMGNVVKSGTAHGLAPLTRKGFVWAKTGTSERDTPKGRENTAILFGLAGRCKDKPEIAFSVIIEEAKGYGGTVCVPIMKEILEYYFAKAKNQRQQ